LFVKKMVKLLRNNSLIGWKSLVIAIIFHGSILSSKAWLTSLPNGYCGVSRMYRNEYSAEEVGRRFAKKEKEDENDPDAELGGIFSIFFRNTEAKKEVPDSEEESSPGIVRSLFKRYQGNKEAKKAKAEAEKDFAARIGKESADSNFFASAFENVISSVRPTKEPLTAEEKRLAQLRLYQEVEREKRLEKIRTQKLADQRSIDRRTQKKQGIKEQNEIEAKQRKALNKVVLETSKSGAKNEEEPVKADEKTSSSNPLSVVQKLASSAWDGGAKKIVSTVWAPTRTLEEWIVVAPKTRISPGEIVSITAAGLDLLLVASKDGSSLHCIANSCPHLGTPLEVGLLDRRPIEGYSFGTTDAEPSILQETDIAKLLTQDGCEDCIVCPLHKTAFALESGEVRGEWCPYPPILGKVMGAVKTRESLPVFEVRTRGKNIEVRLNTPVDVPKS
jgi:nitrite reductase/ring-hydroxylating ferredoxin subunit